VTDLPKLSRPATSALHHEGITTLESLTKLTRRQFLALHGVGPKSLPTIEAAMKEAGLDFAQE